MDYWGPKKIYGTQVSTTNTSSYDPKNGNFAVVALGTRRSWKKDFGLAVEHAANLIDAGPTDEFLIVKVVGRVKRKKTPVTVTKVK